MKSVDQTTFLEPTGEVELINPLTPSFCGLFFENFLWICCTIQLKSCPANQLQIQ